MEMLEKLRKAIFVEIGDPQRFFPRVWQKTIVNNQARALWVSKDKVFFGQKLANLSQAQRDAISELWEC